jgi:hypothetical protein
VLKLAAADACCSNWAEYVAGFGTVARSSSYWLGLENIHRMTKK